MVRLDPQSIHDGEQRIGGEHHGAGKKQQIPCQAPDQGAQSQHHTRDDAEGQHKGGIELLFPLRAPVFRDKTGRCIVQPCRRYEEQGQHGGIGDLILAVDHGREHPGVQRRHHQQQHALQCLGRHQDQGVARHFFRFSCQILTSWSSWQQGRIDPLGRILYNKPAAIAKKPRRPRPPLPAQCRRSPYLLRRGIA